MVPCCRRSERLPWPLTAATLQHRLLNGVQRKPQSAAKGSRRPCRGHDWPAMKIYFKLKIIMQDGASHRQTWGTKGEAALKHCVLCNIRTPPAALRQDDDEAAVLHFLKYPDMRKYTSQEILSSYDRLAAKKEELTKAEFAKREKAVRLL